MPLFSQTGNVRNVGYCIHKFLCVFVCLKFLPGIGLWGLLVAAGSLSTSDTPSQTSSAFWLEPKKNNNKKLLDIVNLTFKCLSGIVRYQSSIDMPM